MSAKPSDYYRELTYLSSNPFVSAKLKLKRAKRHLLEIEDAARELPMKRDYEFLFTGKAETRQIQIVCRTEHVMPLEFAAVVGDAVHNLRCVLDYIAIALTAPPLGTGNATEVYFPTGIDRKAFIEARDGFFTPKGKRMKGKMEGASSEALRMVEELEPYHGGKHSIRALHDLDILDKHKLLVPAFSRLTIQRLEMLFENQRVALGMVDFKPDESGSNLIAMVDNPAGRGAVEAKFDGQFKPAFEIVFGKGQPLEGQPIVESLTNVADVAERFIEVCETHFLR